MNRAQFAAMLQKAINKQAPETPLNFKDVSDEFWGRDVIQKGIGSGFLGVAESGDELGFETIDKSLKI
ncbi:hypothetical protein RintRC_6064 [Richelia intracellularis]|nr:hypothetical protein RintRC_6064 [Richelia intracellularis]